MNILRIIAVLLALGLMGGEAWRSWGVDRPFWFVVDDFIMGVFLIAGAVAMAKETLARRALFAAAWGFNAGLLYSSFFAKIVTPEATNTGNWNFSVLTGLIGFALAISVIGLISSIVLPPSTKA